MARRPTLWDIHCHNITYLKFLCETVHMVGLDLVGPLDLDNESRADVLCAPLARSMRSVREGSPIAAYQASPEY